MWGIPNTKHIVKGHNHGTYEIIKKINGKNEYFGVFHSLEDAIKARELLIKEDWNLDLRLVFTSVSNIVERPDGKFEIRKKIDGKEYYFGRYSTREKAEKIVMIFKIKGWKNMLKKNQRLFYTPHKNIVPTPNGKFTIKKMINKKSDTYGTFNTFEEAYEEVLKLRECDWDYDALCESLDETEKGRLEFLEGVKAHNGFIYFPPNGRIDNIKGMSWFE